MPAGEPLSAVDAAAFDVAMTASVLKYFRHLHLDRVSPRQLGFHRARQIELALERLRWLPDVTGERLLVVNIPMFYEDDP